MKTHLLAGFLLRKAPLLALFMFLMTTFSYAQKVYVSSQGTQIYGLCIGCFVQDPQNAVGPDELNYSSMQIPIGLIGRIEQTLIFPSVKNYTKVVIGIGTNQSGLSAQLLAGVSVETFNGNTSNNDYRIVDSEMLRIRILSPGSSQGNIEFSTTKPYDRIKITLNAGLLNLNGGLNVYYAYQLDKRVYANREDHVGNIQNPQNAVGPNENDFSKLIPYASQTLFFPADKANTKLVIGVGSDNKPIEQLTGLTIKTTEWFHFFKIKPDPQNPYRGTIELTTYVPYNSVELWLSDSTGSGSDLKIYYAYQEEYSLDVCKNMPFDPFYYFSFNGNTNSTKPGFNLTASTPFPEYKYNIACNQGLTSTTSSYTLESPDISPLLYSGDLTIAFWADIRDGDPLIPDPENPGEYLPPTRPQPFLQLEAFSQTFKMTNQGILIKEEGPDGGEIMENATGHVHCVLVLKEQPQIDNACIYINGYLSDGNDNCTVWMQQERINHKKIKIVLDRADIDELAIYNRALSEPEISLLANSYHISTNTAITAPASMSKQMKTVSVKETLAMSPNPTTGRITLQGNLPLQDAEISVRNASGAEVYHSKVSSNVINLPPSLPAGIYILTLQAKDKRVFINKVVLTR